VQYATIYDMMTWYRMYVQREKYRERHTQIFFTKGFSLWN